MAEVRPLRALHYDLDRVGGLDRVWAPPYDTLDDAARAEFASHSPYNIVHIDLPTGGDPYREAATLLRSWRRDGALLRDGDPAFWALEQEYDGPGGKRLARRGIFAALRLEPYESGRIRPHERTHAGPKRDRLLLTRATKANISPIFALHEGGAAAVDAAFSEFASTPPWGEALDGDETANRLWRLGDPETIEAIERSLARAELLIADGHHRYETSRTFASECDGEGAHDYVLACLVATADPGLTVFPTHRLLSGDGADPASLRGALARDFETEPASVDGLTRLEPGVIGYVDADGVCLRLAPRNGDRMKELLPDRSDAYRQLDAALVEELVLRRELGMTDADISAKRGIAYTPNTDDAVDAVRSGAASAAFVLHAAPLPQIRAVARAGEVMPPKTTYFFPKIPSGLLINPLD